MDNFVNFGPPFPEYPESVRDLMHLLWSNHTVTDDDHCNQVYTNIYISDAQVARNKPHLRELGITHIVNTAQGDAIGMVNTNANYYYDIGVKYLGISITDLPSTPIYLHFHNVADFIEEALKCGGKVLVHCVMGISRSATCVIAFLMIKRGFSAREAALLVKSKRNVRPNIGFLHQLIKLEGQLKPSRT